MNQTFTDVWLCFEHSAQVLVRVFDPFFNPHVCPDSGDI